MKDDPNWISPAITLALHDRQLAEHGGQTGLRDESLMLSALARPQQLLAYGNPPPDLCAMREGEWGAAGLNRAVEAEVVRLDAVATALGELVDAPVTLTVVRIRPTEAARGADDNASGVATMLALAAGEISEEDFAAWLRGNTSAD